MPKYQSSNGHHKLFWLVCTPNCALSAAGPSRISVYKTTEGCESQLSLVHAHGPDRALGLCTNPRSKESKPASKEKVVFLTRGGRPVGEYALCNAAAPRRLGAVAMPG